MDGCYSDRIKQLRKRMSLTQTRLAELLGVTTSTVNRWEKERSQPSPLAWAKIEDLISDSRKKSFGS